MPRKFIVELPEVLIAPAIPRGLPGHSQWLGGEGTGSWFVLSVDNTSNLIVNRYNKTGIFECKKVYTKLSGFDILKDYAVTYPSFCNKVTILQDGKKVTITE
jgi:hypothetical protein